MPVVTTAQFVELSRRVRQTVAVDLATVKMGKRTDFGGRELKLPGRWGGRLTRLG